MSRMNYMLTQDYYRAGETVPNDPNIFCSGGYDNMVNVPIRFISAFFIYLPHLDTNIYPFTTTVHPVQSQNLTLCLGSGSGIS